MTTKEKIIQAACKIFSEKGFLKTTTQEICDLAEANIAGVNYHFGNKEKLYLKVWETLSSQATEQLKKLESLPTPEERLRKFIQMRVNDIMDEGKTAGFSRLIHREVGDPSPLHEHIRTTFMEPKRKWFDKIVRDIAGKELDHTTLRILGFCVHSPLIHLLEISTRDQHSKRWQHLTRNKEKFADTIYQFALAGLRESSTDESKHPLE